MKYIMRILEAVLVSILANLLLLRYMGDAGRQQWLIPQPLLIWLPCLLVLYLVINILPCYANRRLQTAQLRNNADGCELLEIFLISTGISVVYNIYCWVHLFPTYVPWVWTACIGNALFCILIEAIIFWNGIIRIYLTSVQLGMKWRIIGALCGMIPVVHLIVLGILLRIVRKEIQEENNKLLLNKSRKAGQICRTKYPILLVHGVFFRDSKHFNYWGRIPHELEENGAVLYYGNHGSAASVEDSARELDARVRQIVADTGCGKVNVVAHSKGGLDCRYALSELGTDSCVASLTTINTPHRGCKFADYLLTKIPEVQQQAIAGTYNRTLRRLGDPSPDFMAAVRDLTEEACLRRNERLTDSGKVYGQSVGSKLNHPSGGQFPLNLSNRFVKYFDKSNDGLVGTESFAWGEDYRLLQTTGKRGISHGDMIDLNRENIDGFDVREFYVRLVSDLRERGL